MTQTLHYVPAEHTAGTGHAIRNLAIVIAAVNLLIIAVGAWDRSWGAIGMMLIVGPIANGLLLVGGLAFAPAIRKWHPAAKLGPYVAAAIFLPVMAYAVDFAVIYAAGRAWPVETC